MLTIVQKLLLGLVVTLVIMIAIVYISKAVCKEKFGTSSVGIWGLNIVPPEWFPPNYPSYEESCQKCMNLEVKAQSLQERDKHQYLFDWEYPDQCPNDCSSNLGRHGVCERGVCKCDPGWTSVDCSQRDEAYHTDLAYLAKP